MSPQITPVFRRGDRVVITGVEFAHNRHRIGDEAVYVAQSRLSDRHIVAIGTTRLIATHLRLVTDTPAPPATALDAARLQAAEQSHRLLGPSASLADLLGVAEFLLGATTGPAEAVEEPKPRTDADAVAAGFESDDLIVSFDSSNDDDVVYVSTDGFSYLDADAVTRLISYLQTALRHHAARKSA